MEREVGYAWRRNLLINSLISAEIDGERLSEDDLLSFCELLSLVGHVTIVKLIGNSIWNLLENRPALESLRLHPKRVPHVIEEVLRYRCPVHMVVRVAAEDTVLGGQSVNLFAIRTDKGFTGSNLFQMVNVLRFMDL